MAAILGKEELNLQFSGKSCSVPAGDLPAISYYLSCLHSLLVNHTVSAELLDYRKAGSFCYVRQNVLITLCLLFNPMDVINKLIILDDNYVLLPKGNANQFCDLNEVTSVVAVSSETIVGGKQTKVTKIMLCTTEWVEKYWVKPMMGMKRKVAEVTKKSLKETDDFLNAVKSALANLMGGMNVSAPPSSTPVTKHCGHCKGLGAACSCKEGCPRKGDSKCLDHPYVICDKCKTQGLLGPRFKCQDCDDFDLCLRCYQDASDEHVHHRFIRFNRHDDSLGTPISARVQCDHPFVTCDMCKKQGFDGARFKCRECENYDLCLTCYHSKSDTHLKCRFWLIPKEGASKIDMPPRVQSDHPNVICDMCKKQGFDGARFQCQECHDFDLCHKCYQSESDAHLECRFWLILKEGDSKIDMPPRVRKTTPSTGMRHAPAVPVYIPSLDPPIAKAYLVNPDYDLRGPSAPTYSSINLSSSVPAPAPRSTPAPVLQVDNFSQGQSVRLHGLSSTSLNGKVGVVEKTFPGEKYLVVIADVGKKVVQAQNMEVVVEDPNYPLNACVELTGLANTQENGKYGEIVGYDTDRVLVKLFDEGRILKIQKGNVLVIGEAG